jgi:hypothetical protein
MEIATLNDISTQSIRLRARCSRSRRPGMKAVPECTYQMELDIETLVCTRGRAFPVSMLPDRLKCPRCGWPRMTVIYDLPKQPVVNAAALAKER